MTHDNEFELLGNLIKKENINELYELIPTLNNINITSNSGDTLLMIAVQNGNLDIINILLENNIDINKYNNFGLTSLFYAVMNNNINIVSILLYNEYIDVNICNNYGLTSLMIACKQGYDSIVELLLENSFIDIDLKDSIHGFTALHYAVDYICAKKKHNKKNIIHMLLSKNANTKILSKNRENVLIYLENNSIYDENKDIINLLYKYTYK